MTAPGDELVSPLPGAFSPGLASSPRRLCRASRRADRMSDKAVRWPGRRLDRLSGTKVYCTGSTVYDLPRSRETATAPPGAGLDWEPSCAAEDSRCRDEDENSPRATRGGYAGRGPGVPGPAGAHACSARSTDGALELWRRLGCQRWRSNDLPPRRRPSHEDRAVGVHSRLGPVHSVCISVHGAMARVEHLRWSLTGTARRNPWAAR